MDSKSRNPGAGDAEASGNAVLSRSAPRITPRPEQKQANFGTFGPWRPGLDSVERKAQFRALTALAAAFCGSSHPLVAALRDAERDEAAAQCALELLNQIPALTRRRILSTFGGAMWPPKASARRGGRE